jgi:Uma2 family endonuclease
MSRTTRAAEGLARWRWTVAEIERIAENGLFGAEDRFELVGGEIVPMSPKGRRHEVIRARLAFYLSRLCPDHVFVVAEPQLNLTEDTYVLPDILVHPASIKTPDVRGDTALLVIEVADSSLGYDVRTKAPLYAAEGVREYWMINAKTLATAIHREPTGSGYASVQELPATERLVAAAAPDLTVRLADFDFE